MKYQILLLALIVAALSSCTTAYKTGQTPDDVYFSPARPADEYVRTEKKEDPRYQSLDEYYDDRFLRMKVQNRYRWSALNDYYYTNPYAYNYYGYSDNWNNPWNNYWTWNNYYNPYCSGTGGGIIIKNPASYTPPPSRPIAFNPSSYVGNNNYQPAGSFKGGSSGYNNSYYNNGGSRYNNRNTGGYSNSSNNNNSYSPSSSTPSRSYSPSSSSSSGGSSSSSGGGGGSSGGSSGGGGGSSRPPR
ncbi:MAG TPA: hypothetical protein VIZ28_15890 [Chitinophagaceae bacterium]